MTARESRRKIWSASSSASTNRTHRGRPTGPACAWRSRGGLRRSTGGALVGPSGSPGPPRGAGPRGPPGVGPPAGAAGSYAGIYQQAKNGVVTINASTSSGGPRSFSQAEGSGIVVDTQGDILTNALVVSGASQIRVTFSDGRTATGQAKGVDQSADLAVVKGSVSADQLHPLPLGNSDSLQVGDTALAIGSPFGLQGSFTAGIISGLNRGTTAPNGRALTGMIQTDAPINPGNSGGALLDGRGQR